MTQDALTDIKEINNELSNARDDLHDAKLGGDASQVAEIEKLISDLNEKKKALRNKNV